ncbi:RGSL protein, partial [Rhinopomastus cyanomelas]|nr:RGSL protein [Rhinopomastus cyanomelas]
WLLPPAATIASTDMRLLLRDDVFVDFFNTFLNLPIFGQTPIYISSTGQWDLWPELPSHLDPSPLAFLAWLEEHRLPHFCKSSLCLYLILCQKLLGFIQSGEAAKLLNWQSADLWLLEKCISGSQGMWLFQSFVQGTAGEELISFWITTERLLGLDESEPKQRHLYLSLLHRLKVTHLREGSSVITLCRTIIGSLPSSGHTQHVSTRREILSKMQKRVLCVIQSYWLPKFFIHCKVSMEKEKPCWPLLQEYQERLLRAGPQEPSSASEDQVAMHLKRSRGSSGPYSSKKAKVDIWIAVKEARDTQEMKTPSFYMQPGPAGSMKESHLGRDEFRVILWQPEYPAGAAVGGKGGTISLQRPSHKAEQALQLEDLHGKKVPSNMCSSACLAQLPSLTKLGKTLSFLPWALSAESCAGQPFRGFLRHQDRSLETRLLDLWHDLEEFLPAALDPSMKDSFFLRLLIGEKICETHLEERTIQQLPLETTTLRCLRSHLMRGEFSTCIFRVQKEICKMLCCAYEDFLADEDKTFLQFMSPQSDVPRPKVPGPAVGKDKGFALFQRFNESLKLSKGLHSRRNSKRLSSKHWQLVAIRALQKGGSIQAKLELLHRADSQKPQKPHVRAAREPSPAEHRQRKEEKLPRLKGQSLATEAEKKQKQAAPVRTCGSSTTAAPLEKPSKRPRHFMKVLQNPAHLQHFMKFLEEHNAEEALHFCMAVEEMAAEPNPKTKSSLINSIVKKYFCREIPAEEILGCHDPIIKEIREAKEVSCSMLLTAQIFVQKAMEKQWFKKYQDLFPQSDTLKHSPQLQKKRRKLTTGKLRWAWDAVRDMVRSFCKFRREMNNDERRIEFENFLRRELENKEDSMA